MPSDPAGNDVVEMLTTVTTVRLSCACADSRSARRGGRIGDLHREGRSPGNGGVAGDCTRADERQAGGQSATGKLQVSVPTPPVACRVAL